MKKLILALTVLFILGCEKDTINPDPVFCWKCNIITTYTSTGYQTIVKNDSITKCGWTAEDINFYMSIKSEQIKIISGNATMTVTSKYDCKVK